MSSVVAQAADGGRRVGPKSALVTERSLARKPCDTARTKAFNAQLRRTAVAIGGESADGHAYGFLCECGCGETVMLVLADYDLQGGAWRPGHKPSN
jgi:hypothetical protein